jgi:hypothetical protein
MRPQNLPELPPVASFEVAPHRYRYDAPLGTIPTSWKEVKEAAPYKPGDVVYVIYGDGFARAYIHAIGCKRDFYGDLCETYEVRRETKAGHWSKRTYVAHPGFIQRGYQRAGMAPEIPKGAM